MTVSSLDTSPHGLDVVIEFVNTADLETGEEQLASPRALAQWLRDHELGAANRARSSELAEAVELREALRALMLEHNGGPQDAAAASVLDRCAQRGRLSVRFGAEGAAEVVAGAGGVAGALGELLIPVVKGGADGSWRRAKACRASDCRAAFFDHSRNRAGVWCDMAVCGNRTKVRAFRDRHGTKG